jgi:hypothetical protein
MYDSNSITRYSSMINHLDLCRKQNKSHIRRSKLRGGIWKLILCITCKWLTETKIFIGGYMTPPPPQDASEFLQFSLLRKV